MTILADTFHNHRGAVRAHFWHLLGDLPPLFKPEVHIRSITETGEHRLEAFQFDNGAGAAVYGYVLIPMPIRGPAPAVLYHHGHGFNYPAGKDSMLQENASGRVDALELVRAGYVVLGIDAYAFGERQQQGPAGERESGAQTELSLFKQFLWEGRTLWGMMVRDDLLALKYLLSRPEVDPKRVGTTGRSLGGSRATWVGALDERIKVTIPIMQMTRYADFAATGEHQQHSIYYFVPGMLASGLDMEHLVSLTAPRAQRILIGDSDPLSPIAGVEKIAHFARRVYQLAGAADQFEVIVYPGVDHRYTEAMCQAMLEGFQQYL